MNETGKHSSDKMNLMVSWTNIILEKKQIVHGFNGWGQPKTNLKKGASRKISVDMSKNRLWLQGSQYITWETAYYWQKISTEHAFFYHELNNYFCGTETYFL